MQDEDFYKAIVDDRRNWLIYTDWLEEQGRPEADIIRSVEMVGDGDWFYVMKTRRYSCFIMNIRKFVNIVQIEDKRISDRYPMSGTQEFKFDQWMIHGLIIRWRQEYVEEQERLKKPWYKRVWMKRY